MAWTPVAPVGTISVRANRTILGDNTTYIQTTMGNDIVGTNTNTTRDHFWNVGSNEDGRHRFINSLAFTVGGSQADPVLGAGMDCILYPRRVSTDDQQAQYFYFNSTNASIYQVTPSIRTGTLVVTGSFASISTPIPPNVYGEILLFRETASGDQTFQAGTFHSTATTVSVAANRMTDSSGSEYTTLRFRGTLLQLETRINSSTPSGNTWQYRITFRGI
jgi:type VI protein secretion system component Hcp